MDTDGDSSDYVDYPGVKPFINSPSTRDLRQSYDLVSPHPKSTPDTNSAFIISALENLQAKIKQLELNRERTLFSIGISPDRSSPRSERNHDEILNLDRGERLSRASRNRITTTTTTTTTTYHPTTSIIRTATSPTTNTRTPAMTTNVLPTSGIKTTRISSPVDGGEGLPSNPSTPRNRKEAKERSSAIGKHLQMVELECGDISSSLQHLRAKALMSRDWRASSTSVPEVVDGIGERRSDSRRSHGSLAMLQDLEKERANLKISQSLAEARIRALEKELDKKRESKSSPSRSRIPETEAARDSETGTSSKEKNDGDVADAREVAPDERRRTKSARKSSVSGSRSKTGSPTSPMRPCSEPRCTCDDGVPTTTTTVPRRERERLCEVENRLNRLCRVGNNARSGRVSPKKGDCRHHYRLSMKHVPFVVGKSTTNSHSLTANIQSLVATLKSHDSGLCDHLRLLEDEENQEVKAKPSQPKPRKSSSSPVPTSSDSPRDVVGVASTPKSLTAHLKEVSAVLDALQDEFAAMSFEHHEITARLKALGVDETLSADGDVHSASQKQEILSLEDRLHHLVAKMNVKGKQIKVLKRILKGLKDKTGGDSDRSRPRKKTTKTGTTKVKPPKSVELGKARRVDVIDDIMVQCIPSSANGARQLLYGIKDLQRTLKEGDVCWH